MNNPSVQEQKVENSTEHSVADDNENYKVFNNPPNPLKKFDMQNNIQSEQQSNGIQGKRLVKTNPFAKNTADLSKKTTVAPSGSQDIFSDLQKGSGSMSGSAGQGNGVKRSNPFASSNKAYGVKNIKDN